MSATGTLIVSPLPVMPGYHPVDAAAMVMALIVEPPLTCIVLLADELLNIPQPLAFNVEPPETLRVPVTHTHVWLYIPPPAIAVADTGTVIIP
jgi:hypothetical protein